MKDQLTTVCQEVIHLKEEFGFIDNVSIEQATAEEWEKIKTKAKFFNKSVFFL
jgi:hypothetical protein